jgi:FkbM family methyltransferase
LTSPRIFVLASTDHGAMLVSRLDFHEREPGAYVGVGALLLEDGSFDMPEVMAILRMLADRRKQFGPGVVAIDGGANIGVQTVEWARYMTGWGRVIAFEPQERLYYALAGNITLANAFNATAHLAALGSHPGSMDIPVLDYTRPANLGGLELQSKQTDCGTGQICRDRTRVPVMTIDGLALDRCDLLKLDVEGMEMDALQGASETIKRCRPIIVAEAIKCGRDRLKAHLSALDYAVSDFDINVLGTPK